MSQERDAVIKQWLAVKAEAERLAKEERTLRDFIAKAGFGYDAAIGGLEGTHKIDLGNGYALKLVAPLTYKVKDGAELRTVLEHVRNLPEASPKPLIKWDPILSVSTYKKWLPEHLRKMMSPAVTTTPGAPQLTLEHPK